MNNDKKITISLNLDQGLVLFEQLSRFLESGVLDVVHESEKKVLLFEVLPDLEKVLTAPLSQNYEAVLEKAREKINIE